MKQFGKEDYGNGVKYWYLFGKKVAKKVDKCFYLFSLFRKDEDSYEPKEWYVGWHDWKFEILYSVCGYEEPNGELHISILGWHSVFKFPWKSRRFPYGDCDAPEYGIAIHNNTFWVYLGGDGNMDGGTKWWTYDLPFFTMKHIRHDVECKMDDGTIKLIPYNVLMKRPKGSEYIPLKNMEVYISI